LRSIFRPKIDLSEQDEVSGNNSYRGMFQGADPVWNVTGSGGTNLKCLAANAGEKWKCLMAQYIAPHVETPIFVLNSASTQARCVCVCDF
jgi:hypothetical protein